MRMLLDLVRRHRAGEPIGIASVCSAHPLVLAAEQHPLALETDLIGHRPDEFAERRRPPAGIAAVLVDLVGGRFDQHVTAPGVRVLQSGRQHQRMRRADGGNTEQLAGAVAPHQLEQHLHADSSGSMASRAAATKASAMPASFSGGGMTCCSASASSAVMSGAPALVSGETTSALP